MQTFENTALITARLGETPINDTSTVVISMEDVYFIKEADKTVWHDGPLTYTITLANYSETETLTQIAVQDMIDINYTSLMVETIAFTPEGAGSYAYEEPTGELTLNINDIEPQQTVIISFQVDRVLP